MLALSLQNEGQASSMVEQGFWESVPEADPARAGPTSLGDIKGKCASSASSLQRFLIFYFCLLVCSCTVCIHKGELAHIFNAGTWEISEFQFRAV